MAEGGAAHAQEDLAAARLGDAQGRVQACGAQEAEASGRLRAQWRAELEARRRNVTEGPALETVGADGWASAEMRSLSP